MLKQIFSHWDFAYENSKVFRVYAKLATPIATILFIVLNSIYDTIREDTTTVGSVISFAAIILLSMVITLGVALCILSRSAKP